MGWIPKVEQKRHFCHKCKAEIVFDVKMQRADACPHCAADLHSCKNCEHWDPSAYNECKEHIAEHVPDREAANRCTFFTFADANRDGRGTSEDPSRKVDDAKAKLEALFKKK
jgi:hypothetical protein